MQALALALPHPNLSTCMCTAEHSLLGQLGRAKQDEACCRQDCILCTCHLSTHQHPASLAPLRPTASGHLLLDPSSQTSSPVQLFHGAAATFMWRLPLPAFFCTVLLVPAPQSHCCNAHAAAVHDSSSRCYTEKSPNAWQRRGTQHQV